MLTREVQNWSHVGAKELSKLTKEAHDELMREHLKKLQVAWKKPRRRKKQEAA
jgi:hypothetical protein